MTTKRRARTLAGGAATLALALVAAAPATAAGPAELRQKLGPDVTVGTHQETGKARFVGTTAGNPVPRAAGVAPSASPETAARGFLRATGADFGLRDQAAELRVSSEGRSGKRSSVRFAQVHKGVPVVGGELIVNVDARGNVLSASGEVSPELDLGVTPRV
jgi:Fungalysin/Thermolysin Propeptide Motif